MITHSKRNVQLDTNKYLTGDNIIHDDNNENMTYVNVWLSVNQLVD